jgi:hypothetical protein
MTLGITSGIAIAGCVLGIIGIICGLADEPGEHIKLHNKHEDSLRELRNKLHNLDRENMELNKAINELECRLRTIKDLL